MAMMNQPPAGPPMGPAAGPTPPPGPTPPAGDNFGPQQPEMADMQVAPGGGENILMEALKIIGKYAILERDRGKPELAQWLAQGIELLSGQGGQQMPGMEQPMEAPMEKPPQAVGPQMTAQGQKSNITPVI